jgi:hypothetical protein
MILKKHGWQSGDNEVNLRRFPWGLAREIPPFEIFKDWTGLLASRQNAVSLSAKTLFLPKLTSFI